MKNILLIASTFIAVVPAIFAAEPFRSPPMHLIDRVRIAVPTNPPPTYRLSLDLPRPQPAPPSRGLLPLIPSRVPAQGPGR